MKNSLSFCQITAVLGLAALVGACNSATITDVKATDPIPEPKHLLIMPTLNETFEPAQIAVFQQSLAKDLAGCGVAYEFLPENGPAQTPPVEKPQDGGKASAKTVLGKSPDAILRVAEPSSEARGKTAASDVKYTAQLFNYAQNRTVWKAEITLSPASSPIGKESGTLLADGIVANLATDGILRSCPL